jgi:hypothetical protein
VAAAEVVVATVVAAAEVAVATVVAAAADTVAAAAVVEDTKMRKTTFVRLTL